MTTNTNSSERFWRSPDSFDLDPHRQHLKSSRLVSSLVKNRVSLDDYAAFTWNGAEPPLGFQKFRKAAEKRVGKYKWEDERLRRLALFSTPVQIPRAQDDQIAYLCAKWKIGRGYVEDAIFIYAQDKWTLPVTIHPSRCCAQYAKDPSIYEELLMSLAVEDLKWRNVKTDFRRTEYRYRQVAVAAVNSDLPLLAFFRQWEKNPVLYSDVNAPRSPSDTDPAEVSLDSHA